MFCYIKHMTNATDHQRHQMYSSSLANGMLVLNSFKVDEPALSNGELSIRTGLSKASISRITYTLCELGFLSYAPQERRYRLGSATLTIGYPLLGSLWIRQFARPFMQELANRSRGSVSLGLRDRSNMVYIETCRGHDAIAFRPDIGGVLPICSTAMGRAWLAGVPPELREQTLEYIRIEQPEVWTRHQQALQTSLSDYATQGFCISSGDWQQDVHAVAVPMRLAIDGETLVFNCGVRARLLSTKSLQDDFGPRLVQMVRKIEADYGAALRQNTEAARP